MRGHIWLTVGLGVLLICGLVQAGAFAQYSTGSDSVNTMDVGSGGGERQTGGEAIGNYLASGGETQSDGEISSSGIVDFFNTGTEQFYQGNYKEAAGQFEQVLNSNPGSQEWGTQDVASINLDVNKAGATVNNVTSYQGVNPELLNGYLANKNSDDPNARLGGGLFKYGTQALLTQCYANLGDRDKALSVINKDLEVVNKEGVVSLPASGSIPEAKIKESNMRYAAFAPLAIVEQSGNQAGLLSLVSLTQGMTQGTTEFGDFRGAVTTYDKGEAKFAQVTYTDDNSLQVYGLVDTAKMSDPGSFSLSFNNIDVSICSNGKEVKVNKDDLYMY
jgi:tetratricopeptide (TPR) repeat protein